MIPQALSLCPIKADLHNWEEKTTSPTTTCLQMSMELTRVVHLSLCYQVPAALRCSNVDGHGLSQEMGCQASQTKAQMRYQWMCNHRQVLCPVQAMCPVSTSPEHDFTLIPKHWQGARKEQRDHVFLALTQNTPFASHNGISPQRQ